MNIAEAILATLASEPDETLRGRTLLQKKLYFIAVLAREDFGYFPHYYGPYSSAITDELGGLVEASLVNEQVSPVRSGDSPFGERRVYSYRLEPQVLPVLQRSDAFLKYLEALKKINAHPIASNSKLLSVAAKVHLILSHRGKASVSEIKERAREFNWDLSEADINQVIEYLTRLDLVGGRTPRAGKAVANWPSPD